MPAQNPITSPANDPSLQPAAPAPEADPAQLRGPATLSPAALAALGQDGEGEELLGQQRAMDAIRLALGIKANGYNVFVTGVRGAREREAILRLIREKAATMPTPGDWVYVNNFDAPEAPLALALKPGQGRLLSEGVTELINYVRGQLPKAFRQEDFDQERKALREKYNRLAQDLFTRLETRAREMGFAIHAGPGGQLAFIPLFNGQEPENPEALNRQLAALPEAEREVLAKRQQELQNEMVSVLQHQQEMMRELVKDLHEIERAFAARLIRPAAQALAARLESPAVTRYLERVAEHMLSHLERFHESTEQQPENPLQASFNAEVGALPEYRVNVFVDNSKRNGAPVLNETAPTYSNLFGTIERWVDPLGRASTNFTRIIAGSFQKADHGFLVIDLEDAIVEPAVWKTLKRSLKTGLVTIETLEPFQYFFSSGLKPEPIAISNKVVVLGTRYLYNLLNYMDSDFAELFKIKAEIRPVIDVQDDALHHYVARIRALARNEQLPAFDEGALARIIEFGMRMAGERGRVLTLMEPIDDLAREAAYFAGAQGATQVSAAHVERALSERILRLNYIEEEIRRLIAERVLVVDLSGRQVGQINGLAVLDAGGYAFGRPSRVTASVALGAAGVINIEREARLSGSIHDKGMMILSGFLRQRYGQEFPLAMSASLCFEQSYSGIEGDSASSTELYALLSALSGVPIRQDLAVTGSVDQYGNVQAIGGVNEKIEGFYRVCKAVGPSASQGVMIPKSNLNNLMLESEVVEAAGRGQFHIYPIDHIDRGIELLTGVKAGTIQEPGTINGLVYARLKRMHDAVRGQDLRETRVVAELPATPGPPPPPPPPIPRT